MCGIYPIGEFARIAGVSIDTLRYYDKIGLLTPEYVDPKSKYRYYTHSQLVKLDIIKLFRKLDMPIETIDNLFSQADPGVFKADMNRLTGIVSEKIKEYTEIEKTIHSLMRQTDEAQEVLSETGFYERGIGRRTIALSKPLRTADPENMESVQTFNRLVDALRSKDLPFYYCGGYLYQTEAGGTLKPSLFEVVDAGTSFSDLETVTVEAGRFFCMHYAADDKQSSISRYYEELRARGYPSGFVLDVYLIDGTFHPENRKFELQCKIGEI